MRILGVMKTREEFRYLDEVVVRSDRGTEIGTVALRGYIVDDRSNGRANAWTNPSSTDQRWTKTSGTTYGGK